MRTQRLFSLPPLISARCSTAPKADVEFTVVKTMEAYFPHCCEHRAESRQGAAFPRDPSLSLILQPPPGLMPLSSEPGTSSDPVSLLAEIEDAGSSSPTSPVTPNPEPGSVSGSSNLERALAAIHLLVEDGGPKLLLPYLRWHSDLVLPGGQGLDPHLESPHRNSENFGNQHDLELSIV